MDEATADGRFNKRGTGKGRAGHFSGSERGGARGRARNLC